MALAGKLSDIRNLICFYFINKILDVRSGHKCFAGALKDDGLNIRVFFGFIKSSGELGHDNFV